MQTQCFQPKIGMQYVNVWFCKAPKTHNYKFGDVVVSVHACCHFPSLSGFLSPVFNFPLILYQSLILPHFALGFLNLSIFLSLSCSLTLSLLTCSLCVRGRMKQWFRDRERESEIMRMKMMQQLVGSPPGSLQLWHFPCFKQLFTKKMLETGKMLKLQAPRGLQL